MKKVHLIMPMGGAGSRFSKDGYEMPKPLIEINDRPFFYWATQSIAKFVELADITFVVLQEHIEKFNIDKEIKKYYPNSNIVTLDHVLNGAVLTCMEGVRNIKDDCPIIFNDCDHLFLCNELNQYCNNGKFNDLDGALVTFKSTDPKYSFLELDETGRVTRTAEKVAISDKAICGIYYFNNKEVFMNNATKYLDECNYSEYFVSGVYNTMINNDLTIKSFNIDYHLDFGTPEEYEKAKLSDKFDSLLSTSFSTKEFKYFESYIKINRDISIIKDYSAGSNATTMLCTKDDKMFFRKYALGDDSEKLYEQIQWIKDHSKNMPLTEIINVKKGDGYCLYDMPYNRDAIGCFNYIHTVPVSKGWKVIEKALDKINDKLHNLNVSQADIETIDKYIESKVLKNIEKIKNGKYIKPLLKHEYLIINGKKYHNLNYFEKYLSKEYLEKLFKNDIYSDIHGDFTIENIIVIPEKNDYYIIDPNTGNLHDSPNLDYAKLLQSLHGGYEFLMNTKDISINDDRISYISSKSMIYDEVYKCYDSYLNKKFDYTQVKSIYFHEIIHWLRLMPYKIEKNGIRSVLFYCGLIIVLNEVIERFGDK